MSILRTDTFYTKNRHLFAFVVAGNFLACVHELDVTNRNRLGDCIRRDFSTPRTEDLRSALESESLVLPTSETALAVDGILKSLTLGLGSNHVDAASTMEAPVEILAHRLAHKPVQSIHDQLSECDPDWLAWDLLWATRFRIFCQLTPYLPGGLKSEQDALSQLKRFREEGVGKLNAVEKNVLLLGVGFNGKRDKLEGNLLIEIREHLNKRGRLILRTVDKRL